jgi:hypothetical protein
VCGGEFSVTMNRGNPAKRESWTDEERQALTSHIEEGFSQAERGELNDGDQARREIQAMKVYGGSYHAVL